MDILDTIRDSFAFVAGQAQSVRIDDDALDRLAIRLPDVPVVHELDRDHHLITRPDETAAYILMLDSVNFGSGYKPFLTQEGWQPIDGSIYFGMSCRLKSWFEAKGMPAAKDIATIAELDVQAIFDLPDRRHSLHLTTLFTRALQATGRLVATNYHGDWMGIVDDAGGSAARMTGLLAAMPEFRDVHAYAGRDASIYKRAQIAAADLHYGFKTLGQDLFSDIHRLTMFADNAVPHVLRVDNVLSYTPELTQRIDSGDLLQPGSPEEVEIRCCAGEAVERLSRRKNLTSVQIDHMLWNIRFDDSRYRQSGRPHRTLTTDY